MALDTKEILKWVPDTEIWVLKSPKWFHVMTDKGTANSRAAAWSAPTREVAGEYKISNGKTLRHVLCSKRNPYWLKPGTQTTLNQIPEDKLCPRCKKALEEYGHSFGEGEATKVSHSLKGLGIISQPVGRDWVLISVEEAWALIQDYRRRR